MTSMDSTRDLKIKGPNSRLDKLREQLTGLSRNGWSHVTGSGVVRGPGDRLEPTVLEYNGGAHPHARAMLSWGENEAELNGISPAKGDLTPAQYDALLDDLKQTLKGDCWELHVDIIG